MTNGSVYTGPRDQKIDLRFFVTPTCCRSVLPYTIGGLGPMTPHMTNNFQANSRKAQFVPELSCFLSGKTQRALDPHAGSVPKNILSINAL